MYATDTMTRVMIPVASKQIGGEILFFESCHFDDKHIQTGDIKFVTDFAMKFSLTGSRNVVFWNSVTHCILCFDRTLLCWDRPLPLMTSSDKLS